MIATLLVDIWTVMRKDLKEYLSLRSSSRAGLLSLLIVVGIFGVLLPVQSGRAWVEQPGFLIVWIWMPLFLVTGVVADSFAGERERHTLETLLASRLSDRAILLGKVGATVLYGWGLMLLCMAVGLVAVNLVHGRSGLILYPLLTALAIASLSLLSSALAAAAGVLVSLRAATVRQAQQSMSIALLVLFFGAVYGGQALLRSLPQLRQSPLLLTLAAVEPGQAILAAVLLLLLLDLGLLAAAMARFQRARLI